MHYLDSYIPSIVSHSYTLYLTKISSIAFGKGFGYVMLLNLSCLIQTLFKKKKPCKYFPIPKYDKSKRHQTRPITGCHKSKHFLPVCMVSGYSVAWPYYTYSDLKQLLLKAYILIKFLCPVHIS